MATQPTFAIVTDETQISELTVEQFNALVAEEMQSAMVELLAEFAQYLPDPEDNWTVAPEVLRDLREFINQQS